MVPISARSVPISPRQRQTTSPTTTLPRNEIDAAAIDVDSIVMQHLPAFVGT